MREREERTRSGLASSACCLVSYILFVVFLSLFSDRDYAVVSPVPAQLTFHFVFANEIAINVSR